MTTLTLKVPNIVNQSFIHKLIYDLVIGEGGDGWAYIVCDAPDVIAKDFIQVVNNKDLYISSEKEGATVVNMRMDQSVWLFTTVEPTKEDLRMYEFVLWINQ